MNKNIITLLIVFIIVFCSRIQATYASSEDTIIVFSDEEYPPYEYSSEGEATGFNVDVLDAVAKVVGLDIEVRTDKWENIRAGIESGDIELISGMFYSKERDSVVDFSQAFVYVDYTIFKRAETDIKSEKDVFGKKIIVQKGDIMEDYIRDNKITEEENIITVSNPLKAIQLLDSGKYDCAFVGRMQGHYYKKEYKLENIEALEISLAQKEYCFAVSEGNTALKNKLDEGLKIIKENGTYEEIYSKWFRGYEQILKLKDIIYYGLVLAIPILLVLIGYTLWVYLLKIEVNKKTEELKVSQAELNKINEKLEFLVKERTIALENTIRELQLTQNQLIESEKMSALGTLVAGVTHEINTPIGICLTAISYYEENLKHIKVKFEAGKLSRKDLEAYFEKGMEVYDIMTNNLIRAAELIRSFKQISVDQSSEIYTSFSIYKRIRDTYLSIRPKFKNVDHNVIINGSETLKINGYPGFIAQIFTNLMLNSFLHGKKENEKLTINIDIKTIKDEVIIVYIDNGKGIPESILNKIFEPFFTTTRGKGGTGLGLNIIYNIITNQIKGSIVCRSKENEYTKFIIKMPMDNEG